MELPKEHFRYTLILFFNQKKVAVEDYRILIETYDVPSIKTHMNIDSVDSKFDSKR